MVTKRPRFTSSSYPHVQGAALWPDRDYHVTSDLFALVNEAARGQIRQLAERWLGTTRLSGDNLLALNPTRADRKIGSFGINVRTGAWADFATDDRGGDIVSFYAAHELPHPYPHGPRPAPGSTMTRR